MIENALSVTISVACGNHVRRPEQDLHPFESPDFWTTNIHLLRLNYSMISIALGEVLPELIESRVWLPTPPLLPTACLPTPPMPQTASEWPRSYLNSEEVNTVSINMLIRTWSVQHCQVDTLSKARQPSWLNPGSPPQAVSADQPTVWLKGNLPQPVGSTHAWQQLAYFHWVL